MSVRKKSGTTKAAPPRGERRARRAPAKAASGPRVDNFVIKSGALGPVGRCSLEIRPLTIFIGRQGTGKSLVSQTLYALEELPFLAPFFQAKSGKKQAIDGARLFAQSLDRLRSAERRFATFAEGPLAVRWERGAPWEGVSIDKKDLSFRAYKKQRAIDLPRADVALVDLLSSPHLRPKRHAVFMPTERMVVSQLRSALAENLLSLPVTYELFADWLERAAAALADVPTAERGTPAQQIAWLSELALGGAAKKVGTSWKWTFSVGGAEGKKRILRQFDLDMASSGQRANWSLGFLASALFLLRGQGDFADTLTLFIEEPELHLHPAAEVAMARILAILVKGGFRVVVTTHSLNFLYAINNQLLAWQRFGDEAHKKIPVDPAMRLRAEDVSVYAFPGAGAAPVTIIDRKQGFISEHELGDVGAQLGAEMNFIATFDPKER